MQLESVRYSFFIADGPDPGWHVRALDWTEELSGTYEIVVELITTEQVEIGELLGASAELLVERSGLSRTAYGIIHRVDELGVASDQYALRAYVVPALALARQRVDARVFQGLTVIEIVSEVLEVALAEFDRELDPSSAISSEYEARDYCVQYFESDFNFCARLLEDEGIAFLFESDDENSRERLVLVDSNEAYRTVDLVDGAEVPVITDRSELVAVESIRSIELVQRQRPTRVRAVGWNWKVPGLDDAEQGGTDSRGRTRERYHVDDRRQIIDDPLGDPRAESFTGGSLAQREPLASKWLELFARREREGHGHSNVTGFGPGARFTLGDHPREGLAHTELLLIRVHHRGEAPEVELDGAAAAMRYENHFECIPMTTPYRPARRTLAPRVHGAQTATVMGPSDHSEEDIHTDPHGRIKVRFHWDRLSPEDGRSSCWVRVAQTWAGAGWGTMFIPRVGMEVVVEFLDGNPDRPLVIGCVYNARQVPPYALPDAKTKSTIKSDSSPGGGGFNELRFEDAKGSEEIFLHAQKDFNEVVLEDHSTRVEANQSNSVGGDQSETVSGKQTLTVEKNRKVTIHGSQSVEIKGAAGEDGVSGSKLAITGDWKCDASNTISMQAPTEIKLVCGGSSITLTPGRIEISAGGEASLVLDANALLKSAAGSKVLLDANALAQSSGGSKVLLDANALMSGTGTGTVQAPTATLAGGGGSVEAGGAGVTCAGGQVNVTGGMVNVSGGLVKIN